MIGLFLINTASAAFGATAPYGGQIVFAYYDQPTSLNPLAADNGVATVVCNAITNGLMKPDVDGKPMLDLAKSYEVSSDGLTWTFHLQGDVKFSDGRGLTSRDVVATFRDALDPASPNRSASLSQKIKSVTADGDLAVKFLLSSPDDQFGRAVQLNIAPASAVAGTSAERAQFDAHPVGTGPFKISQWTKDEIVVDANMQYFAGRPHLDRIIFKYFPNQKAAWTGLMQGNVDLVLDIDTEDYNVIKDDPRFKTYGYLDTFCYMLVFNLKDPLFADRRMRQAVSYAIDRQDLVDRALQGGGIPTTGPFQPGTWPYNPDPSIQPFDPGKASALLASLGWKDTDADWILDRGGRKLEFTVLALAGDKLMDATLVRLQWQLLQVGIKVNVETGDTGALVADRVLPGKFQSFLVQLSNFSNSPDPMVSTFWQTSAIGRYNFSSYSSPELDKLAELGRATTDQAKKAGVYRQIHQVLGSDVPAAFLYYRKRYTAATAHLGGIPAGLAGFYLMQVADWYLTK